MTCCFEDPGAGSSSPPGDVLPVPARPKPIRTISEPLPAVSSSSGAPTQRLPPGLLLGVELKNSDHAPSITSSAEFPPRDRKQQPPPSAVCRFFSYGSCGTDPNIYEPPARRLDEELVQVHRRQRSESDPRNKNSQQPVFQLHLRAASCQADDAVQDEAFDESGWDSLAAYDPTLMTSVNSDPTFGAWLPSSGELSSVQVRQMERLMRRRRRGTNESPTTAKSRTKAHRPPPVKIDRTTISAPFASVSSSPMTRNWKAQNNGEDIAARGTLTAHSSPGKPTVRFGTIAVSDYPQQVVKGRGGDMAGQALYDSTRSVLDSAALQGQRHHHGQPKLEVMFDLVHPQGKATVTGLPDEHGPPARPARSTLRASSAAATGESESIVRSKMSPLEHYEHIYKQRQQQQQERPFHHKGSSRPSSPASVMQHVRSASNSSGKMMATSSPGSSSLFQIPRKQPPKISAKQVRAEEETHRAIMQEIEFENERVTLKKDAALRLQMEAEKNEADAKKVEDERRPLEPKAASPSLASMFARAPGSEPMVTKHHVRELPGPPPAASTGAAQSPSKAQAYQERFGPSPAAYGRRRSSLTSTSSTLHSTTTNTTVLTPSELEHKHQHQTSTYEDYHSAKYDIAASPLDFSKIVQRKADLQTDSPVDIMIPRTNTFNAIDRWLAQSEHFEATTTAGAGDTARIAQELARGDFRSSVEVQQVKAVTTKSPGKSFQFPTAFGTAIRASRPMSQASSNGSDFAADVPGLAHPSPVVRRHRRKESNKFVHRSGSTASLESLARVPPPQSFSADGPYTGRLSQSSIVIKGPPSDQASSNRLSSASKWTADSARSETSPPIGDVISHFPSLIIENGRATRLTSMVLLEGMSGIAELETAVHQPAPGADLAAKSQGPKSIRRQGGFYHSRAPSLANTSQGSGSDGSSAQQEVSVDTIDTAVIFGDEMMHALDQVASSDSEPNASCSQQDAQVTVVKPPASRVEFLQRVKAPSPTASSHSSGTVRRRDRSRSQSPLVDRPAEDGEGDTTIKAPPGRIGALIPNDAPVPMPGTWNEFGHRRHAHSVEQQVEWHAVAM